MTRVQQGNRWFRYGVPLILVVGLFLGVRHSFWAARCTTAMVEQPMPDASSWQSWPVLSGLAGYVVVDLDPYDDPGLTSGRPHAMGDARLAGHGVCAERGASVQSWFGQYFTATSGDDWTIRFRQEPQSGLVLVTGERTRPSSEPEAPTPIVAFLIEHDGALTLFARLAGAPALVLALFIWWLRQARAGA